MEPLGLIVLLVILFFWSAFFSGSEMALFSLPHTKVHSYSQHSDKNKRLVAQLLSQPRDLLVTIFMLNTLVNILLQNVASDLFKESGWILKVGVPLVLTLFLGEILPKYIGLQNNVKISNLVAKPIYWMQEILTPLRKLIVKLTVPISRVMFFYLRKEPPISTEEIEHVLEHSEMIGVLTPEETELVCGYLDLQESSVREMMRPKEEILYYRLDEPLTKLIHLFVDEKCTRLPVCHVNLDAVEGLIDARTFFINRERILTPEDLLTHLNKPFYVPENTPAKLLWRRFGELEEVFALVVDQYGSISGLVTDEDLAEVVIGSIEDSRDSAKLYTLSSKGEVIASGKMEIEELNEILDCYLESPNGMVTIGGWLMEQLDEIPRSGTKLERDGLLFQVLAADPKRIQRVFIRKLSNSSKRIP